MNWGRGLTLMISAFIIAMLGMVYISFQQTNEMVEDNYYEREIKYQEIIDAKKNLEPYLSELKILDSDPIILIELPKSVSNDMSKGVVEFVRLDRAASDRKIEIVHRIHEIPKTDFSNGVYTIKLKWNNGEDVYFYEGELFVKK